MAMQEHPTPETIEELKAWYEAHHLPPESVTRFFIGKDVYEPKAFGIYRDGDRFVVYKNKANGLRAVRYHGPDERYAVNELYQRLRQEIALQKADNQALREQQAAQDWRERVTWWLLMLAVAILVVLAVRSSLLEPDEGYYRHEDTWYYCQSGDWYAYEEDAWYPVEQVDWQENAGEYFLQDGEAFDGTDFALTQYYAQTDTDSDWSSDDTWFTDNTDWDSDW